MTAEEDLEGFLTIEGPILEMAYAALCITRDEKVVPRYETMGVFHDILIHQEDGYVVGECLGSPLVSVDKLTQFRDQVMKLNDRLIAVKDDPIIEVRIISMTTIDEWDNEAKEALKKLEIELDELDIDLKFIGPKRIVYDLISNSILGMRLYDNHIFFVGPGEWAIRYDPKVSKFQIGVSSIDFNEFKKLPHSFMPRDYWGKQHRKIFEEYAEFSHEPLPEWFKWEIPDNMGIRWKSVEQIKNAIIHSFSKESRDLVYESNTGFITLRRLKKFPYYTANLVYHQKVIDSDDAINLEKGMTSLIEDAKEAGKITEDLDFYNRIFTDTVTFTHSYWLKARYKSYHGKVSYTEINRGEDVLMEAFNSGVLGFKIISGRMVLSLEDSDSNLKIVNGALHFESVSREIYPADIRL